MVYLQNSYLTSELLLNELIRARKRGIEVHLIYPRANDSKILDVSNQRFAATLLEHGGQAYLYPGFSHVKAVMVDDWVCLGSANLDGLSMRINGELNIAFSDPKTVDEIHRRLFLKDIEISKRLQQGDLKVPPLSPGVPLFQQL